jgi:hypothetical protein
MSRSVATISSPKISPQPLNGLFELVHFQPAHMAQYSDGAPHPGASS